MNFKKNDGSKMIRSRVKEINEDRRLKIKQEREEEKKYIQSKETEINIWMEDTKECFYQNADILAGFDELNEWECSRLPREKINCPNVDKILPSTFSRWTNRKRNQEAEILEDELRSRLYEFCGKEAHCICSLEGRGDTFTVKPKWIRTSPTPRRRQRGYQFVEDK